MEALKALGPALVLVGWPSTCACAQTLSGECWAALAWFCSELISFLLQYIFADAYAQYLWITFDFCNTIQGFSIPFRAADLLLHSKASNLLLGFDRSHPNKQVRASRTVRRGSSSFLFCPRPMWTSCPLSDLPLPSPSSSLRLSLCSYDFTSPWHSQFASQLGSNM